MVEKNAVYDTAAARREYYREWRKKNPDKVKAIQERYWMKKAMAAAKKCAEAMD